MLEIILYSLLFFIVGSVAGSIANFVSIRLQQNEAFCNIPTPCPHCSKKINLVDLIPFYSYIFGKGYCSVCGKKISYRKLICELACGLSFLICFLKFGFSINFLIAIPLCFSLLCLSLVDLDTQEIPNRFILICILLSVISFFDTQIPWTERLIGAICISAPLAIIYNYNDGIIGFGDIKLLFACGAILGWKGSIIALVFGIIYGGISGMLQLLSNKKVGKKTEMAFGPYLSMGIFTSFILASDIIALYLKIFL